MGMINSFMVLDVGYYGFAVTGFQAPIAMNDDSTFISLSQLVLLFSLAMFPCL